MDLRHHTYRNACEFDKVLYKYLVPICNFVCTC